MGKHFTTLQKNKGSQVAKFILMTKRTITIGDMIEETGKQNSGKQQGAQQYVYVPMET